VAEGEYKNGVGSIIALIDAQTARSTARTQLVRAQLDWYTAMARFERAIGRTLARGSEVAVSGKVKS
jgi:outer membrane protein TolC